METPIEMEDVYEMAREEVCEDSGCKGLRTGECDAQSLCKGFADAVEEIKAELEREAEQTEEEHKAQEADVKHSSGEVG